MSSLAVIAAIVQQTLTGAVPLAIAGSGELLAQRAGVINVGIEGLMLTGCITGFAVTMASGSPWVGLVAAMLAGGAIALVFAIATILARVDQIVAGMAVNLLAVGISGTAWAALQNNDLAIMPPQLGFQPFGPGILHQHGVFWFAIALLIGCGWMLSRMRIGVIIAAIGDAPDAAAASGIHVRAWRIGLVVNAGLLAGLAGSFLSIMRTHGFVEEMTGGQGFLVLALVIFGRWRAWGLAMGCLLFGGIDAIQQHGQAAGWTAIVPYQAFKALPYLTALIALTVYARRSPGPLALNQAWPRDR